MSKKNNSKLFSCNNNVRQVMTDTTKSCKTSLSYFLQHNSWETSCNMCDLALQLALLSCKLSLQILQEMLHCVTVCLSHIAKLHVCLLQAPQVAARLIPVMRTQRNTWKHWALALPFLKRISTWKGWLPLLSCFAAAQVRSPKKDPMQHRSLMPCCHMWRRQKWRAK